MDITKKINDIYSKIAMWHNGDNETPSSANLKILAQEIVEDMINFTIQDFEAKTKVGVEVDNESARKEFLEKIKERESSQSKKKEGFFSSLFKK